MTLKSLLWLVGFLLCGALGPVAQAAQNPPASLLRAMERGVNLSIWFTYRGQSGIDPARWYPDAADWRLIKSLGFGHVRVQFDPVYFRDPARSASVQPIRMRELQDALAPAFAAGLVVVLAAEPQGSEKSRLVKDEAGLQELEAFWRAFAKAMKGVGPSQLVFEALNEPTDTDASGNQVLMRRLVKAIRSVAPQHTVVVEGHRYSGVDELLAMTPLPLPNLIYSFHFYEPHTFTHQGAFWSWPMFLKFRNLPYPSSPQALAPLVSAADADARPHLLAYGEQRWGAARIETYMDRVQHWAQTHRVPVWCGEFGVSRLGAPDAARKAWLADTRHAMEARGIAWTLFDYVGHFALVTGNAGERQLDPQEAAVLGLRVAVQ